MLELVTPENVAPILVAIGLIVTAIGGLIAKRALSEAPKPGTPDAAILALAANTDATRQLIASSDGQAENFKKNLAHFEATVRILTAIQHELQELRSGAGTIKSDVSSIRDNINRGRT